MLMIIKRMCATSRHITSVASHISDQTMSMTTRQCDATDYARIVKPHGGTAATHLNGPSHALQCSAPSRATAVSTRSHCSLTHHARQWGAQSTPCFSSHALHLLALPARLACSPRVLASPARLASSSRQLVSSARLACSPRLLASWPPPGRLACSPLACSPRLALASYLLASPAHLASSSHLLASPTSPLNSPARPTSSAHPLPRLLFSARRSSACSSHLPRDPGSHLPLGRA